MTVKQTLTIEEFSAQLADQPQTSPEVKEYGQLTLTTPDQAAEAVSAAGSWGWW